MAFRDVGLEVLGLLGGSWVVISEIESPLTWVISIVTLLITLLITTNEPPSRVFQAPQRQARSFLTFVLMLACSLV